MKATAGKYLRRQEPPPRLINVHSKWRVRVTLQPAIHALTRGGGKRKREKKRGGEKEKDREREKSRATKLHFVSNVAPRVVASDKYYSRYHE